uniref:Ion_trans domain-containing protein n=1 Tax=Macrostomum lignano TaxID=282301 RepID=A0A1I8FJ20_9PLAT
MYGVFSAITFVVLLNMLIAMMNCSYESLSRACNRTQSGSSPASKLWISYFEEGGTLQCRSTFVPSPKTFPVRAVLAERTNCAPVLRNISAASGKAFGQTQTPREQAINCRAADSVASEAQAPLQQFRNASIGTSLESQQPPLQPPQPPVQQPHLQKEELVLDAEPAVDSGGTTGGVQRSDLV